ncbi:ent-kaurene synthase [Ranunculus cassubicifolius]
MFNRVEVTISSYDTAWMAMVPSLESNNMPWFPECVHWILNNQLDDGSWFLPRRHHLLTKDAMMSTLACLLALKRWGISSDHVRKGTAFIESNFEVTTDKKQLSPIGFDIIFPGMLEYAKDLDFYLNLTPHVVETMLHKRDFQLQRSNSKEDKAYLAYIYEGVMKSYDWHELMKYQRNNGSLFNSPATTAAALTVCGDVKCYGYLRAVLEMSGNAVPTVFPNALHIFLSMVDRLEKLGIGRHFRSEIKHILDEIYSVWLQREDEIFSDIETCALAFRLLRVNGYEVSSDTLSGFGEREYIFNSDGGGRIDTILELHQASQLKTHTNERVLEMIHSLTTRLLKQNQRGGVHDANFHNKGDHALNLTYDASVGRLETRRYIESYCADNIRILKTSYRYPTVDNKDFLQLAVEDYNFCQGMHQKELEHLERWIKENRLDQLEFARQKLEYAYFSIACILPTPELSDARISWAKNVVLATVVDDFFDVGGSKEELQNLINLVQIWNENSTTEYCSKRVEIIIQTLQTTINELDALAFSRQGRSVKTHIIDLWLTLLKSMMREYEWASNMSEPTMEEYMENASISFALGPVVLISLYFLGPKISEEMIRSSEYNNLFNHLNICGRLYNDIQGFKRESKAGKLNSVSLHVVHGRGSVTEEDAVTKIKALIDTSTQNLLRLVLQIKGSVVPKACKDLFWKTNEIIQLFYKKNDGFTSSLEMVSAINAVLREPINLPSST